jgi:hypothetical protein
MSTYESTMRTTIDSRDEDFMELVERFIKSLWEIFMHMVELNILL